MSEDPKVDLTVPLAKPVPDAPILDLSLEPDHSTHTNTSEQTPEPSASTSEPSASHPAPSPLPAPVLTLAGHTVQVFGPSPPPINASTSTAGAPQPADLDDAFFEPTLSDVQSHHASVIARSKRLNEAPLLTSKYRDQDRAERERRKADKWPATTIRIKFSDGTQIQSTFPSTSPIQPVYEFVRSALDPNASTKTFMLWQPPRMQYPEHPVPTTTKKANPHKTSIVTPANYGLIRGGPAAGLQGGTGGVETLNDLGLVPQSVLLVRWEDEAMNASSFPAPLLPELMERSVPLPAAVPKEEREKEKAEEKKPGTGGEKKIPKWLQKGLMKRK